MLVDRLAVSLNSNIDIPFLTELQEDAIFRALVTHIVEKLPPPVVTALDSAEGFVSPELLNETLGKLIGVIKSFLIQRVPALRYNFKLDHMAKGIATHVLQFAVAGKSLPQIDPAK